MLLCQREPADHLPQNRDLHPSVLQAIGSELIRAIAATDITSAPHTFAALQPWRTSPCSPARVGPLLPAAASSSMLGQSNTRYHADGNIICMPHA